MPEENDIIQELHKRSEMLEPKEGQRGLLCSAQKEISCPSLRSEDWQRERTEFLEAFCRKVIRLELEKFIKGEKPYD